MSLVKVNIISWKLDLTEDDVNPFAVAEDLRLPSNFIIDVSDESEEAVGKKIADVCYSSFKFLPEKYFVEKI